MTPLKALTVALRKVAHDEHWCKHSDLWHDVAHGDEPGNDQPEVAIDVARNILCALPPDYTVISKDQLTAALDEVRSAECERLRLAYIEAAHGSGISGRAFLSVLAIFRTPDAKP